MGRNIRISDGEWDVMEIIWGRGVSTAAEVIAAVAGERGWNHSTVRTMLARLVEKGVLKYEVNGTRYIYRPAVTRKRCVREESRSFVDKVFGGDINSLMVHFAREAQMAPETIEKLRDLLHKSSNEGGQDDAE